MATALRVTGPLAPVAGTRVTLTAQRINALGQDVPGGGSIVSWSYTGTGTLWSGPAPADSGGAASVDFTVGTTANITQTLTATSDDGLLGTIDISILPGAFSASQSTVSSQLPWLPPDGASTSIITVTERDAYGNLTNATSGACTITTDIGSVGPVTTPAPGTHVATFTAPATAGVATISSTVNGQPLTALTLAITASGSGPFNEPSGMTTLVSDNGSVLTIPKFTVTDPWSGLNGWGGGRTALVADASNPTGSGWAVEKRWFGPETLTAAAGATTTAIPLSTLPRWDANPGAYKNRLVTVGADTVTISSYSGGVLALASALSSAPAAGTTVQVLGLGTDAESNPGIMALWHWKALNQAFGPVKQCYVRLRVKFSSNWPVADGNLGGVKWFYLRTSQSTGTMLFGSRVADGSIRWASQTANNPVVPHNYDTVSGAKLLPDGSWHTVEYLFDAQSAVDVADGRVRTWIDGAAAGDVGGVMWVSSTSTTPANQTASYSADFDGVQFYMLRGTTNYRFDRDDWMRVGEIYISGK